MEKSRSKTQTEEILTLREQAEELVRADANKSQTLPSEADAQRLVHELQVHQIELRMQNAELCQTRDDLESANIELEAFNYTIAHELRKYMTTINGYCQVIRDLHGKEHEKRSQEYLKEIYQATLTMDRLIDSLLQFSSVDKVPMRRQPVDLSAIAKSIVADLNLVHLKRCTTFHIAPRVMVEGDPELLQVVLLNLIDNACKHSGVHEGVSIEFGTVSLNGEQVCFVRDTGPGFDMELAEQIFAPFQRLPGTSIEGHGIGLATVERIIKRLGGKLWAESYPGKGTTFFFTCA